MRGFATLLFFCWFRTWLQASHGYKTQGVPSGVHTATSPAPGFVSGSSRRIQRLHQYISLAITIYPRVPSKHVDLATKSSCIQWKKRQREACICICECPVLIYSVQTSVPQDRGHRGEGTEG